MSKQPENGTHQIFDDKECVYYDGYWIRYYPIPEESLANRKALIDSLTRRTFHHTEAGINTPGEKLEVAREAYERETDAARKRVNGAMLAGALFNRATDLFTAIVGLEEKGVKVSRDNELMRQCAACFKEALELGKQVKHYSGEEGIDELWGEPFKAFTQPLDTVFESRYRKISQTMRDIDLVCNEMIHSFQHDPTFDTAIPLIQRFQSAAKNQLEIMKSDDTFFQVWPDFIASREALDDYRPTPRSQLKNERDHIDRGLKLITSGAALITYLSEARVPMPKTTQEFLAQCDRFEDTESQLVSL